MTVRAIYPYAIVPAGSPLPAGLFGLRGASVERVPAGRLAALVSELPPFQAAQDDLLTHHRVVEAACAAGPALPVRFGTRFRDPAALARSLTERQDALLDTLTRVGHRREVAVTLEWLDPPSAPAPEPAPEPAGASGPGARFLVRRAAQLANEDRRRGRAEALAEALLRALRPAGISESEVKRRIVTVPRLALSCAVLTDAVQAGDVMRRVREAAAGWVDVRAHLAGPWPPYSFSEPG